MLKKVFVGAMILVFFAAGHALALKAEINLSPVIGSPAYTENRASDSSMTEYVADSSIMPGLGLSVKLPLSGSIAIVLGGQYNLPVNFTAKKNSTIKGKAQVIPFEGNVQYEFDEWYIGGGLNYSMWTASGTNPAATPTDYVYTEVGGLGQQIYVGLSKFKMVAFELKAARMTGYVPAYSISQAFGAVSLSAVFHF